MLGLRAETDPAWVEAVEGDLPRLLSDHAHCELKAAQNALSILGRFGGEVPELVAPLVDLAQEETEHFRAAERHLVARGERFGHPESDPYVVALRKAADRRSDVPVLLDRLLVAALIEGRSCERFRLLSEGLRSRELRSFYRELMVSEARHYRLFLGLAETIFGFREARARFDSLATREADIVSGLPLGPTMHG